MLHPLFSLGDLVSVGRFRPTPAPLWALTIQQASSYALEPIR